METSSVKVNIIENVFIPMSDGVKIAARIWLPIEANKENPVPAIFEAVPYRKRDTTTSRDEVTYQHFALHGYAGVRADTRGCGDSTGLFLFKSVREHDEQDGLECIDWISKQDWCTGNVGMMGICWGGVLALSVAARQPEALKAIIIVNGTDDNYLDQVHYKGGAMLLESLKSASGLEIGCSLPPDPLLVSDWLKVWLDRLEGMEPISRIILSHQTRDYFWKRASISEDYSRIKVPAFLVTGYADGYVNATRRILDNIQCPRRAIVGPWTHLYPHLAVPGPKWGFCTEALNWWDRWLKGKEIPEPPNLVVYIQKEVPVPCPEEIKGRWIQNPTSNMKTLYLNGGKLGQNIGSSTISVQTNETCGHCGGNFYPADLGILPVEQSPDDQMSKIFESDSFEKVMEFLGRPILRLRVASDKPVANVFTRLCIVDPEGNSRLIGFSAYNLNHDERHETVTQLNPGEFKDVTIKLDFIGEQVQPGYTLRLALSSACFPIFVPNPEITTLSLDLSQCQLDMPVLVKSEPLADEIPPVTSRKILETVMRSPAGREYSKHVDENGRLTIRTKEYTGEKEYLAHGLVTEWLTDQVETISGDDPTSATYSVTYTTNWSRGDDWKVNIHCSLDFTMDKDNFFTDETRVAKHNGEIVFSRTYKNVVKRDGV